MIVVAVKTPRFNPPQDELFPKLKDSIPELKEGDIILLSSKIISTCEGNCVPINSTTKDLLVSKLADKVLLPDEDNLAHMVLTQIDDVLVESAGIDRSNANGYYVLLPKDSYKSAKQIWSTLRKLYKLKRLGVIITDSHSVPERKGAIGMALASYGFIPLRKYVGKHDVFGASLGGSTADLVDGLAAAATLEMGEGAEMTPVAIISGLKHIRFYRKALALRRAKKYLYVSPKKDVYGPLLRSHIWNGKNGSES